MNTLIFGIALSAVVSLSSLLIILFRVSPLSAPQYAVPSFIVSVFLTVSTVSILLFIGIWSKVTRHSWDTAKLMSISMRQGIFVGSGTLMVLLFLFLGLLTWWIALMIYAVFLLIELALDH